MNALVTQVLPLVLMFAVFYFLLIRPQQKRQKAVAAMQSGLQKGDRIITIGGLHGVIDSVSDTTVVIKTGDGSHLTFERNAVREVTAKKEAVTN
ncbi:preprotein translocase subunit YajC [Ectobacillus antri]|jgi:preprotein translocase subunit YajC|uniref:Preprotein translocase subunit YajC n=1 Tax=Ectobacillus antri TaxID=2486280 RepID=A0ABT6H360_9BACI|nr:preprotein translocase subunit YajC [Ectobacillus antri]MDG4655396.1 preprotein translocase subunit YajC [Ectobacillus antri]MDG5753154.1 preprotein translocase subunit YajC [Ectobacillus antri]